MTDDITSKYLEAALLDQKVAGMMGRKDYAFVAQHGDGCWVLGVAVANEPGYYPLAGKTFPSEKSASVWADGLNRHIGVDDDTALRIVVSTMGGRPFSRGKANV